MNRPLCLALLLALSAASTFGAALAERLGYKATDKLVILNIDDVGMCHAANVAAMDALENGLMTSATIMVPCPWFLEIAEYAKKDSAKKDFGLHLVHTSEWGRYKWGPVAPKTAVPGLIDDQGYLHRDVPLVYLHSNAQEAYIEARAQIEKALKAGIDVTHLDSHMGTMQLSEKYLDMYVKLGVEYNLPLRMGAQSTMESFGFPQKRKQIADLGIVFTDYFVHEELKDEGRLGVKPFWTQIIRNLKPGVTELYIHAAKDGEELRAITGSWQTRNAEYELFTHDAEFKKLLEDEQVIRIGYRALRDLQRREHPKPVNR